MIPQTLHQISEEDIRAINLVLREGAIARGNATRSFEDAVAQITNKEYGIAFANGTVALWAAIRCINLLEGIVRTVHTSTLTFSAIANAALLNGNGLELYDVYGGDLCGDFKYYYHSDIAVPMDYAGYPHNQNWTDQTVIRDACHSFCHDRDWSRDDMTVFSFHPAKTITCGEGGMIVTDNGPYADMLRCIRDNGRLRGLQVELGLNLHISEIGAVLGLSQLTRLDKIIERRRELVYNYLQHWREDKRLMIPLSHPQHAWHLYVIRLEDGVNCSRDKFREELLALGIRTQVHYRPLHKQQAVIEAMDDLGKFPVADEAYSRMLSIPLYYGLTDEEQKQVIDAIDGTLDKYGKL